MQGCTLLGGMSRRDVCRGSCRRVVFIPHQQRCASCCTVWAKMCFTVIQLSSMLFGWSLLLHYCMSICVSPHAGRGGRQVNNSISLLSLEWNNVGTFEQGIQSLADGLEVNASLTTLVLCNNHITAEVSTCMNTTRLDFKSSELQSRNSSRALTLVHTITKQRTLTHVSPGAG